MMLTPVAAGAVTQAIADALLACVCGKATEAFLGPKQRRLLGDALKKAAERAVREHQRAAQMSADIDFISAEGVGNEILRAAVGVDPAGWPDCTKQWVRLFGQAPDDPGVAFITCLAAELRTEIHQRPGLQSLATELGVEALLEANRPPAHATIPRIPVGKVDPYEDLKVARSEIAEQWAVPGGRPPYVPRELDSSLRQALLTDAFVIVHGTSQAGKSRSAFEAVSDVMADWYVQVPSDAESSRALLQDLLRSQRAEKVIVWIEDLDDQLWKGALDHELVERLQEHQSSLRLLGMMQSASWEAITANPHDHEHELVREVQGVVRFARSVGVTPDLRPSERKELKRLYPGLSLPRSELGPYLSGASLLVDRLASPASPQGVAVARAAIDWARVGISDPISARRLNSLHMLYRSRQPLSHRAGAFAGALKWAATPLLDTESASLLLKVSEGSEEESDLYAAHSYIVEACSGHLDHSSHSRDGYKPRWVVSARFWFSVIKLLEDERDCGPLFQVGLKASALASEPGTTRSRRSWLLQCAERAWRAASKSDAYYGATSGRCLGDLLAGRGHLHEANEAYDEVVARFAGSKELRLQVQAAIALVNKGHHQPRTADGDAIAIKIYDSVKTTFGNSTESLLQEQVAIAQVNKGHRQTLASQAQATYSQLVEDLKDSPRAWAREQHAVAQLNLGHRQGGAAAIKTYEDIFEKYGRADEPRLVEQAVVALVNLGHRQNDDDTARATYGKVVAWYGEEQRPEIRRQVVIAQVNVGHRHAQQGHIQEAIVAYDQVFRDGFDSDDPEIREQAAIAMVNKGHLQEPEPALETYQSVVDRIDALAPQLLGAELRKQTAIALVSRARRLHELGRDIDACDGYERVFDRFASPPNAEAAEPEILEQVAIALVNKGHLRQDEPALVEYERVRSLCEGRLTDMPEWLPLARQLAVALINKGNRFVKLRRRDEALDAYSDVATRFGTSGPFWRFADPELRTQAAVALVNKGHLQVGADSLATYSKVERDFGGGPELEQVAIAMVNRGHRLKDRKQAISVYKSVVSRLDGPDRPLGIRRQIAIAQLNIGHCQSRLGQLEAAVDTYEAVIKGWEKETERDLRVQVVIAQVNEGHLLARRRELEKAIDAYTRAVTSYGDDQDPDIRRQVAIALVNKADRLGDSGRHYEALATYDEVDRCFRDASDPELQTQVAIALVNKGHRCAREGDLSGAFAAYGEAKQRFAESPFTEVRIQASIAQVSLGQLLLKQGVTDGARASFQAVVDTYLMDRHPRVMAEVADALLSIGQILADEGLPEHAVETYAGIIDRYSAVNSHEVWLPVAWAMVKSGECLTTLGRLDEARVQLEKVAARLQRCPDEDLRKQVDLARTTLKQASLATVGLPVAESDQASF